MDAQDQTPTAAAIVEAEVAPVPTSNVVMTPDVAEAVVADAAQRASFFGKDAPHENGDAGVPVDLAFEGADAKGTEWDRMVAAAKAYGMTATELEATAKKSLEQMTEAEATRIADRLETLVKQGKKYAAPVVGATPVKA
jgi:hypothetical protein